MPLLKWQKENEHMAKGEKKEESKIYNRHVHFNQSQKRKEFQGLIYSIEDQGGCREIYCSLRRWFQ